MEEVLNNLENKEGFIENIDFKEEHVILCKESNSSNDKKNYCEHNKIKRICKDCKGISICEHNRMKTTCKECKGNSICEHNKIKYICKDCKGKSICIHDKIKYVCIDCKGSQICIHNNIKAKCKDCKGYSLCIHNKEQYHCKECNGKSFCIHDKKKYICKDCNGNGICIHDKQKNICKECKGSSICIHDKNKFFCKECKGISICIHNKPKQFCKECGGSSYCEHNKLKHYCRECGSSSYCEHNKLKHYCKDCGGSAYCIHNKEKSYCKICNGRKLCKSSWCETHGNKKYDGYCVPCFVNNRENKDKLAMRNYKTKETEVVSRIKEIFPHFSWVVDKKIQDGCSRRRPDLLLDLGSHIIIVEIDENKHTNYDCSCENKRLMEISQDLGHRPIIFIRFNPDDYINQDGKKIKSCWRLNKLAGMTIVKTKEIEWNERINSLIQQIKYWIDNITEKTVEIIQLFY